MKLVLAAAWVCELEDCVQVATLLAEWVMVWVSVLEVLYLKVRALLIAAVVVFAESVPVTEMVCAAALLIVPPVALVILTPVVPVAGAMLHVTPTWLAGTLMV